MMGLENFGAIVKMSEGWWGLGKGRKELRWVDCTSQPNGRSSEDKCQWLEFPEGTLGYVTCALAANSTKRRKKMGSSVAYKTIGTFLLQDKRHEDA